MEKRAIQVSHEMWQQTMTQGHTSGGLRCIKGLPEDATLHLVTLTRLGGKPDAVLVFESDSWKEAAGSRTIQIAGQEFPLFVPMFRIAECRTCKQWNEAAFFHGDEGWRGCNKAPEQIRQKGDNIQAVSINDEGDWAALETSPSFGCTEYEPRETND